jgi:hypothetical protein
MARPKTGIDPATEDSIRNAIAQMAADPALPRTRANLAVLAGVGRATIYRGFEHRPQLREAFTQLTGVDPTPAGDAANEALVRELRKDNRELRRLLDATATTVEHLLRDNKALRTGQPLKRTDGPPPRLATIGAEPVKV